ncbi:MAG: anhydro-N-acetylmuramic acid kinase [Cellvibrionaceae bacterium]
MQSSRTLFIGLISGTSVDGIDAVLMDFQNKKPILVNALTYPISKKTTQKIKKLMLPNDNEIDRMGVLDQKLGDIFADAANKLLEKAGIEKKLLSAIGSHGQTIRHRPEGALSRAFTLQIADPNIIAEQTGITTIADFRRRDMAAGGQGAPLVPAFHEAVFSSEDIDRVILNIGGISNITVLSKQNPTIGYDTGPGNALMDEWISKKKNLAYDENGKWAESGLVNEALLNRLLDHDYFREAAPKSTGREVFTLPWLELILELEDKISSKDVQATLLELTTVSISNEIKELNINSGEVYVCGGGAHNAKLMSRLSELLPRFIVTTTEKLGIGPDWVEGAAFAWLAKQTLDKAFGNLPSVTGASRPVILGGIYQA